MPAKDLEKELLSLERQYWQAIKDKNVDAAMRLTDYPCIVAGTSGVGRIGREEFEKIMSSAPYTLHHFEVKDGAEVRLLSPDVAILAYEVHEELTIDGERLEIDAADTSVWVWRDGRWLCSLHTETLTGVDPYGRDRVSTSKAA